MIRLALFGQGRWGKNIIRTLENFADVSVVLVAKGETGPRDIDGVIIATPISTHTEIALPYVRRGVPVFIEKPVTDSVPGVERLIIAARKSRSLVRVGHVHLHNPAFQAVKKHIRSLGPLRYMYFEGFNNGPFRKDATILWDWLPHPLSMALSFLRGDRLTVQGWGITTLRSKNKSAYDIGVVRYEFSDGMTLLCTVNWNSPEKRTKLTIVGSRNALIYNDGASNKIELFEQFAPVTQKGRLIAQQPAVSYPQYLPGQPLELELRAFVDAIEKKSRDSSDLMLGLKIAKLIEATHVSIRKGGAKVSLRV